MAFMLLLAVAAWVDAAVRRAGPTGHSAGSRDCGLRQTRRVPGGGRDQRTTDSPTPDSAAPPQPHRPRSSCQPSTRRRPDDQASRRMPVRGPEPRVGPRRGPRHGRRHARPECRASNANPRCHGGRTLVRADLRICRLHVRLGLVGRLPRRSKGCGSRLALIGVLVGGGPEGAPAGLAEAGCDGGRQ